MNKDTVIKKWFLELHLKKCDGKDSPNSSTTSSPRLSNASTNSYASSNDESEDSENTVCNTCRNCFSCWLRRREEATEYEKREEYERIAYECLDAEKSRIIEEQRSIDLRRLLEMRETEKRTYEQELRLRLLNMQLDMSRDSKPSTPPPRLNYRYSEIDSDDSEETVKPKTTRKKNQY